MTNDKSFESIKNKTVNKNLLWRPWSRWRKKFEGRCISGNLETADTDGRGCLWEHRKNG
jgi:hypothetical protein